MSTVHIMADTMDLKEGITEAFTVMDIILMAGIGVDIVTVDGLEEW